jgi:glycerol-3-phosphate dehydrogenase (NAD(P)+)
MRIAIVGAGSWGTALSIIAAHKGHTVRLWARRAELAERLNLERENGDYLPQQKLPEEVQATASLAEATRGAEIVLYASPSHAAREILRALHGHLAREALFVSAAKGIEAETGKRISEIFAEELSEMAVERFVALSGPSFAREVLAGYPTAIVAASRAIENARLVQTALSHANLRLYANDDLIGTEMGGAVKNVIALAAGMVVGLGLGTNSLAALITRGLAEMTRLAVAVGGRAETMLGLAGVGDLVLTCTGELSRNRYVGRELGRGRKLEDVMCGMHEVAEGIRTARAVRLLAERYAVRMPITEAVHAVIYEGKNVRAAVDDLMARPLRDEFD